MIGTVIIRSIQNHGLPLSAVVIEVRLQGSFLSPHSLTWVRGMNLTNDEFPWIISVVSIFGNGQQLGGGPWIQNSPEPF